MLPLRDSTSPLKRLDTIDCLLKFAGTERLLFMVTVQVSVNPPNQLPHSFERVHLAVAVKRIVAVATLTLLRIAARPRRFVK